MYSEASVTQTSALSQTPVSVSCNPSAMSLLLEFQIVQVLSIEDDNQYILAKQIEPGHDFNVKAGTYLGTVELDEFLDIPRALDDKGQQRQDLFIFKPKHPIDKSKLSNGIIVRLTVPE